MVSKVVSYDGLYVSHGFQESHWLYHLKSVLIPGDCGIGYEVCKWVTYISMAGARVLCINCKGS